jgi:predicted ATPase
LRASTQSLAREVLGTACSDEHGAALARSRELLAPVYGWFTEGFDTLDLKDAKTLLDELA